MKMVVGKTGSDKTMIGIPRVWHTRFTGWVWLLAYCATHCSLVRPPSMVKGLYLAHKFGCFLFRCAPGLPRRQHCMVTIKPSSRRGWCRRFQPVMELLSHPLRCLHQVVFFRLLLPGGFHFFPGMPQHPLFFCLQKRPGDFLCRD